jgi:hypothetical protein
MMSKSPLRKVQAFENDNAFSPIIHRTHVFMRPRKVRRARRVISEEVS